MANLVQVVALVNHIPASLGIPCVSLTHRDLVLVARWHRRQIAGVEILDIAPGRRHHAAGGDNRGQGGPWMTARGHARPGMGWLRGAIPGAAPLTGYPAPAAAAVPTPIPPELVCAATKGGRGR